MPIYFLNIPINLIRFSIEYELDYSIEARFWLEYALWNVDCLLNLLTSSIPVRLCLVLSSRGPLCPHSRHSGLCWIKVLEDWKTFETPVWERATPELESKLNMTRAQVQGHPLWPLGKGWFLLNHIASHPVSGRPQGDLWPLFYPHSENVATFIFLKLIQLGWEF